MRKLITLAVIGIAIALTHLPHGQVVRLTVEYQKEGIAIRDQFGRGKLFYRGLPELKEWLIADTSVKWEQRLQAAMRNELKDEPLREISDKPFRIVHDEETSANGKWSKNLFSPWSLLGANSATTLLINTAFTYETSGTAAVIPFNAPATQTNAALTIYVYCTTGTGSATTTSIDVYASAGAGEDPQRPKAAGSPIGSSSTTDASGCTSAAKWLTYSISSVSLTLGNQYFAIVKNGTATPASNNFTVNIAGTGSNNKGGGSNLTVESSCTTSDGITTDPVCTSGQAAAVFKFSGGQIFGGPYVATGNPSSTTNYRGSRVTFTSGLTVSGLESTHSFTSGTVVTVEIYSGASQLITVTTDVYSKGNGVSVFFTPTALTANTPYDFVFKLGSAATSGAFLTMGNSPPADVQSAAGPWTYVNGATPGSFTETTNQYMPIALIFDDQTASTAANSGIIQ